MRSYLLIAITFLLATGIGYAQDPSDTSGDDVLETRRQRIAEQEKNLSEEALARRKRSIAILKEEKVSHLDHLPTIATEAESKRRSTEEVATRAMALCVVAVKGEGLEQDIIDKLIEEYKLEDAFTPDEKKFIENPNPTQHDRIQFAWRYECYAVMVWALGFTDELERPDKICDVQKVVAILRENGREGFLKKAKLRSQAEILDAADLIYRYHWAVVDARVKKRDPPAKLEGGVVMERHYVLNWLIGYFDQEWDDISTDT